LIWSHKLVIYSSFWLAQNPKIYNYQFLNSNQISNANVSNIKSLKIQMKIVTIKPKSAETIPLYRFLAKVSRVSYKIIEKAEIKLYNDNP